MWGCRTLALVDWVAASIRDCTLLFSGRELALRPVQQLFMVFMDFPRASGILRHPTSIPRSHGIRDFGPEAHRFVEFLQLLDKNSGTFFP